MNLLDAETGVTYTVKEINTDDEDLKGFLLRLGCYGGEPVTVVSRKRPESRLENICVRSDLCTETLRHIGKLTKVHNLDLHQNGLFL